MMQTVETTYRYRWTILGVLWITYIVVYLNRLSVGPLAPFLKGELGLDNTRIGLVVSAAAIGYVLTQLPTGWIVDKTGARLPMAVGELIAGTAVILIFFASSYVWLLVLMFIAGIGCGCLLPSTTQGVVVWFPPKERATIMGLKQTSVNLGGIISAAILPIIAVSLGWRYGFLFIGLLAVAIGGVSYILYREPPLSVSGNNPSPAVPVKATPIVEVLKNRDIWLVSLSGACFAWIEFAVVAHLVLYLTEKLSFAVIAAGGLLALAQAAGMVARPGCGLLSDRIFGGKRKVVLMLLAGTASAMSLVVALFGAYLSWMTYPVIFLLGFGGTGFGGIFLTLIAELGGRQGAGKAAGLSSMVANSGIIVGPVAFGYIVDTTASYYLAWLSLALIGALGAIFLVFVKESQKRI